MYVHLYMFVYAHCAANRPNPTISSEQESSCSTCHKIYPVIFESVIFGMESR